MINKIILFLFSFFIIITSNAANKIILPPRAITFQCRCNTPNKQGVCRMYLKGGTKQSPNSGLAQPLTLNGGWIVQPTNCTNRIKYHLTRGSVLFNGKKLLASYGNPKIPAQITGYVYHVTPNLPFTKQSYSVTIVKNPAISGIDFKAKNSGWQCGYGNGKTLCSGKSNNARCFIGSRCDFIYKKRA